MIGLSRVQWIGLIAGLALLVGYIGLFSWTMGSQSYNTWGAFIVFPVIVLVNAMLVWRAGRIEKDSFVTGLLIVGLFLKSIGVLFRYYSVFFLYDGAGDAKRYNDIAALYYAQWREGNFAFQAGAGGEGTQAMEVVTTALYTLIGPSPLLGFFVFASFAFWGTYLIFRAFRTALPGGDYRRYAVLLFLLPSLIFWPSSIGKESWLLFFVGLFAFGAAQFFSGRLTGLGWLVAATVGMAIIRPHFAVLLMAAAATAQVLRPTDKSPLSIVAKAAGSVVMVVGVAYLTLSAADFLNISDLSTEAVVDKVTEAGRNTGQGGSAFVPVPLGSPIGIPAAMVTILFRPFPWEAMNAQMLAQGLEGLVLAILLVRAWPRLKRLPLLLRTNAYITFAVLYSVGFILVFAGFANFGILARQRVLMLPFFLILLALPAVAEEVANKSGRKRLELSHAGR